MPVMRTFLSPEEIWPGKLVSYDEVRDAASAFNRSEATKQTGLINLLLSTATIQASRGANLKPLKDVQEWLVAELIEPQLARHIRSTIGASSLLERPLLHRTQVLFALRLLATYAQAEGGNPLETKSDRHELGHFLLLVNGLYRAPASPPGTDVALWVASQTAPLFETENPPDLALSWPRLMEFFKRRLPHAAHHDAELAQLERVALFSTGFSSADWLDLSFLLYSFWASLDVEALLADSNRAHLSLDMDHEVIASPVLRRVADALAASESELYGELRIDAFSRQQLFDLTPFRKHPLWLLSDNRVFCPDPVILMDRLGPYAFWTVQNALDSPERRRAYSGIWGAAFEDYCLDQLSVVFQAKKWSFVKNPKRQIDGEELWDALAYRDDTALVIECKGTFIAAAHKYSGESAQFFRGLSKKFGRSRHGGVYQLLRGIDQVWFRGSDSCALSRTDAIRHVFPMLVVQDPAVECGPVSRVLSDRLFAGISRLQKRTRKKLKVWPLTVVSVEDLEQIAAGVEVSGARVDSLLKSFHRSHPSRMIGLGDFMQRRASEYFGPTESWHQVLRGRFQAETSSSLERFRAGAYHA